MKKMLIALCLIMCTVAGISAQQHLTVEITHPVYLILDNAVQRGILPILPGARPYSKSTVIRLLEDIQGQRALLTPYENTILNHYYADFTADKSGWKNGKVSAEGKIGSFHVGMTEESEFRTNLNNVENFQMTNVLKFYAEGDMFNFLSYAVVLGGSFDRIAPDFTYRTEDEPENIIDGVVQLSEIGPYAPYHFTKEWEGFHLGLDGSNTDGVGEYLIGFHMSNEITAQFLEDALIMRLGYFRREWGQGDGSLSLSGTARPFQGVEIHARPVDWFNYSYIFGSLGDWFYDHYNDDSTDQKNFTLQSIELMITKWLYLNASGSVIWGKRFELGYISPLVISVIQQNILADFDNVGMTIGAAGVIPYVGKLHAELFIDEFRLDSPDVARNIFGIQAGLDIPIPKLPFTTFTFQYTKLEPFLYTHYDEDSYPFYSTGVNMSYTNDGENLGYYLPPNSDEFLFRLESLPHPQITAALSYKLIRHGTDTLDSDGNPISGLYYGDINIPIDYDYYNDGGYDLKDFLNDGIYDWTNMASLDVTFRMKSFPMEIGFSYTFSHTFWDANDTGIIEPDPIIQNIVAISVSFFD